MTQDTALISNNENTNSITVQDKHLLTVFYQLTIILFPTFGCPDSVTFSVTPLRSKMVYN